MASYRIPTLALRVVRERMLRVALPKAPDAAAAATIAHAEIGSRACEHLIAILVDGRHDVTGIVTLAIGGLHGCGVSQRDVLRNVLASHASAFILAHNHPSGDPTPSPEDLAFTRSIAAAAEVVGVPLLDHIIVTGNATRYRSAMVT